MVPDLDGADLDRAVGRHVSSYTIAPIDPDLRLHSVTGGVHRVSGDGFDLVVKVVRNALDEPGALWTAGATTEHRNYWKREWCAFDSGLLDRLPGRLRAPRRILTTQPAEDEAWIWMESVRGRHGPTLDIEDYRHIAHDLATTQGAYPAGAALPDYPWLARGWLRSWVDTCGQYIRLLREEDAWRSEPLTRWRPLLGRIAALWSAREELFAVAAEAPVTVVHCDFWPTNLFVTEHGDSVAIDWSQIGIGGLTQDLDQLTLDTVWMQVRPEESLDLLESTVLDAYRAGLAATGADIDPTLLRRWYAANASLHYSWLAGAQVDLLADPDAVAFNTRRFGRDVAVVVDRRRAVVERALTLGEWVLGNQPVQ